MDWKDPNERMKQLPVAYSKEWVMKKINEI